MRLGVLFFLVVGACVAETSRFGPAVFLVPAMGGGVVGGLRDGRRGIVEKEDVVGVGGVGVEDFHGIVFLIVRELACVGGNDVVKLGLEGGSGEALGIVVVGVDGGDFDGKGA